MRESHVITMQDVHDLIFTFVYSGIGLLVFSLFFIFVLKVLPFPILKEIEEDQNIALSILLGAVVIGLSIIIASAIH
jgi:uncharacterized membrane protein YjfL (UPF0719 family)